MAYRKSLLIAVVAAIVSFSPGVPVSPSAGSAEATTSGATVAPYAKPYPDCAGIADPRARQNCQSQDAARPANPKGGVVLLCMRSAWDHWYSAWLWWILHLFFDKPYPPPPVWHWAQPTRQAYATRLPDYQCFGSPIPPRPADEVFRAHGDPL
jgi:hypothetical protein